MNRIRILRRRVVTLSAATTIGVGMLAMTSPVFAVTPGYWTDFNGDGFADLAIGIPNRIVNGHAQAGVVEAIYGSSTGLDPATAQLWTQDSPGIRGVAEANDHFGASLAAGDFNSDGFGDLAIGVPGEDAPVNGSSVTDIGAVQVIYGYTTGLTDSDTLSWDTTTFAQAGAEFGTALVALDAFGTGDVLGHKHSDLAVGVPGASLDMGGVTIIQGGRLIPTANGGHGFGTWTNIGFSHHPGARIGSALAAGAFDSNPLDDLAVGAPKNDSPDPANPTGNVAEAGMVIVLYNGAYAGNLSLFEGINGTPSTPGPGDNFGTALAVAHDSTGSPYDTLFAGSPFQDVGGVTDSGNVFRFAAKSNGSGIDPAATTLHQGTAKFPDSAEAHDRFGSSIAVADLGHDSGLDVIVGVPGQKVGSQDRAGAVMISFASGETAVINQDTSGIVDSAGTSDEFGRVLFAANFGNGGKSDIAVGMPRKDIGPHSNSGEVAVIYGSSTSGFDTTNDQALTEPLGPVSGNHFGAALR